MAERIDSLTDRRGRPPAYPWGEWTDGSAWRIWQGVDFEVAPASMASAIRQHAYSNGFSVSVMRTADGDGLEFQFSPDPESEAAA